MLVQEPHQRIWTDAGQAGRARRRLVARQVRRSILDIFHFDDPPHGVVLRAGVVLTHLFGPVLALRHELSNLPCHLWRRLVCRRIFDFEGAAILVVWEIERVLFVCRGVCLLLLDELVRLPTHRILVGNCSKARLVELLALCDFLHVRAPVLIALSEVILRLRRESKSVGRGSRASRPALVGLARPLRRALLDDGALVFEDVGGGEAERREGDREARHGRFPLGR
mmetsp:Transcript_39573/g.119597  ORF Transcript_39573/g.119597 Transcript_39573/m.119597 type:complete len:225 (-) Transcript_39573:86-760(-)